MLVGLGPIDPGSNPGRPTTFSPKIATKYSEKLQFNNPIQSIMEDDDKISFPSISAQKSSYWGELGLILILELAFIVVLGILYIVDSFF